MWQKLICFSLLAFFSCVTVVSAQEYQRWNGNIGGGVQIPLGETSRVTSLSGHLVGGIGANFTEHLGMNGEFLWTFLPVKQSAISQSNLLGAHGYEAAFTINGIYRIPIKSNVGLYVIGGGGWYNRYGVLRLQQSGLTPAVICGGLLLFLVGNDGCVNGQIPTNQVEQTRSTTVFGGNVGTGLTVPVGNSNTKLYLETRYHHAPHNGIATQNLLLTFGVRW